MKEYKKPELEIVIFTNEDVITWSGDVNEDEENQVP